MMIFHCYVSSPEGNVPVIYFLAFVEAACSLLAWRADGQAGSPRGLNQAVPGIIGLSHEKKREWRDVLHCKVPSLPCRPLLPHSRKKHRFELRLPITMCRFPSISCQADPNWCCGHLLLSFASAICFHAVEQTSNTPVGVCLALVWFGCLF